MSKVRRSYFKPKNASFRVTSQSPPPRSSSPLMITQALEISPPRICNSSPLKSSSSFIENRRIAHHSSPVSFHAKTSCAPVGHISRFEYAASRPLLQRKIASNFKESELKKRMEVISKLQPGESVAIDSLGVQLFAVKGRGVIAIEPIEANTFIGTYPGPLITKELADTRDKQYEAERKGCFLFYFETVCSTLAIQQNLMESRWSHHLKIKKRKMNLCVDATNVDFSQHNNITALMNHSKKMPNVNREIVMSTECMPFICFTTAFHISTGEELVYDYGDNRRVIPCWCKTS